MKTLCSAKVLEDRASSALNSAAPPESLEEFPSTQVVIIGGGIIGLATALELTTRFPGLPLLVIEKEPTIAFHQTGHNSGVIHSGVYYKPGSFKAQLCVEGYGKLLQFCQQHSVPFELCGKIIVATDPTELPRLDELFRRGTSHRIPGLRYLAPTEIHEVEPYASGIRGLHVPGTGIVSYAKVCEQMARMVIEQGGRILLSTAVTGFNRHNGRIVVETSAGGVSAKLAVNCAGLQSDRISQMANARTDVRIVPFRGEYYDLSPRGSHLVKGLIYPVPDPDLPFLGVHFTRRISGGVEAGPNAVLAFKREGYQKTSFRALDVLDFATFPGFWKMAASHWRTSIHEVHRSWSKALFVKSLQKLVPSLAADDLVPGGTGVRAQAISRSGSLLDDFHFVHSDGVLHVCNVPSPAATASLAIARHIVDTVVTQNGLAFTH